MASLSGRTLATDGRFIVTSSASSPAGSPYIEGAASRIADGYAYYTDLVAAAVPATAVFNAGLAYSPTGSVYATTSTTGVFYSLGGNRVRSDGALFIAAASPAAIDTMSGALFRRAADGATLIQSLA